MSLTERGDNIGKKYDESDSAPKDKTHAIIIATASR
jgi:hypothetical protein